MKIFFGLLLAANVMLFAGMRFFGGGQQSVPPELMNADKIVIESVVPASAPVPVSAPVDAPVVQASAVPVAAPVEKTALCFEWGEFSGADQERAAKSLKKLQLGDKLSQREVDRSIGVWVYIPPLKDKAAIAQKVAQLKARGVTEYFVVQDGGEWQGAISLGVFKSREAAQNYLSGLRSKGVSSAKLGERSGKSGAIVFLLNALDEDIARKLTTLQKDFDGSELKTVSCH